MGVVAVVVSVVFVVAVVGVVVEFGVVLAVIADVGVVVDVNFVFDVVVVVDVNVVFVVVVVGTDLCVAAADGVIYVGTVVCVILFCLYTQRGFRSLNNPNTNPISKINFPQHSCCYLE